MFTEVSQLEVKHHTLQCRDLIRETCAK